MCMWRLIAKPEVSWSKDTPSFYPPFSSKYSKKYLNKIKKWENTILSIEIYWRIKFTVVATWAMWFNSIELPFFPLKESSCQKFQTCWFKELLSKTARLLCFLNMNIAASCINPFSFTVAEPHSITDWHCVNNVLQHLTFFVVER